MRKIRVLHVGLSDNVGGIETVVRSWNSFLPDDVIFDFINVSDRKLGYEDEFSGKGARIYRIPSRKEHPRQSYRALKRILAESDYDYLHHHVMSLSWPEPVLLAAKCGRTKAIVHSHTMNCPDLSNLSKKYRLLHLLGKERLNRANYLRLSCGELAGISMFQGADFKIIRNGIDRNAFAFDPVQRAQIRQKYRIKDETFMIGHVGRPSREKNYPFLLRAFYELLRTGLDCKLLLIGNLQDDAEVNRLVTKLDLEDDIIFAGFIEDCAPYYSAMDCFFFPSLYEGFSVSLVEAQANGLPCVVSKNIAPESKLSDNFIFVGLESTDEAIKALCSFRHEARKAATSTALTRFDIQKTAESIFTFYRENLAR